MVTLCAAPNRFATGSAYYFTSQREFDYCFSRYHGGGNYNVYWIDGEPWEKDLFDILVCSVGCVDDYFDSINHEFEPGEWYRIIDLLKSETCETVEEAHVYKGALQ